MISHEGLIDVPTCLAYVSGNWKIAATGDPTRKAAALAQVDKGMALARWLIDCENQRVRDPSQVRQAIDALEGFVGTIGSDDADLRERFELMLNLAQKHLALLAETDRPAN